MNTLKQIPKWEVLELSFEVEEMFNNPFLDVSFSLVVVNEDQYFNLDGFYDGTEDGKNIWRARFAPMYEGSWRYKTFSNIPQLNGIEGAFVCVEPISRGPLTVSSQFPNWFFRADGKAEWINNDGWYPHPLFGETLPFEELDFVQPSEEDMKTYFKILGEHKVNIMIEVGQSYARQSCITDTSFIWPWKVLDAGNNKIDKDYFNLEYYQRMDRIISYAKEQGVFYGFELLFDNSVFRPREWSAHPINVKNGGWLQGNEEGTAWGEVFNLDNEIHAKYIGRYIAYTVARLSAHWNVYWALGAECGNIDKKHGNLKNLEMIERWYGHWGDFVAHKDPHGRLQSIGDTGELPNLIKHCRNNIIMTQEHTNMDDLKEFCDATNRFGERFWKYSRPMYIGEQDRHNCNKYDTERKGYWVAFASGFSMGRVDRHFDIADGDMLYESKVFNIPGVPPIYKDLKRISDFVHQSGIRFWRLSPHDDLLKQQSDMVYCLAEPGCEYMVYFAAGGVAQLGIDKSEYSWFNPRTGIFTDNQFIEKGLQMFKAPDNEDWVLYIHSCKKI